MKRRNEKAFYASVMIFLAGIILVLLAILLINAGVAHTILFSIGLSFISSNLVIFITRAFELPSKMIAMQEAWKMDAIYETRSQMNSFAGEHLAKIKYNYDIIGFGLKSLRESKGNILEQKLALGLRIRILTMDPNSIYLQQREKDENKSIGEIRETIIRLVKWVNSLKAKYPIHANNLEIRFYDAIPLEHFCKQDDIVFVGSHQYGKESQQAITFQFSKPGTGFDLYVSYFERLWNDANFSKTTFQESEN